MGRYRSVGAPAMISMSDYFGIWYDHEDATEAVKTNAGLMLQCVNALLLQYPKTLPYNPHTGSLVSGTTFGGFRPKNCPQGAANSSHKEGNGIDIYDPHNDLDAWITDDRLKNAWLYREDPSKTPGWLHLTTRAPGSGKRTFMP